MNLVDASALLCFVRGESGSDTVRTAGGEWALARGLLTSLGLTVEPVTAADAERAAMLWRKGSGLSIADRICLATGERLVATVWTADAAWGESERIRQVR